MLIYEAINVKTVMINQLRYGITFLIRTGKAYTFNFSHMRNITAVRLLLCAYKKIKTF